MRKLAAFIFVLTALLYGVTLASVSYVGVYVTYVALPLLLVFGCLAVFGGEKEKPKAKAPSLITESLIAVTGVLGELNEALDGVNDGLARFNRANELKRERGQNERALERQLRTQRAKWEVHLNYASSADERIQARAELAIVDAQLATVRAGLAAIYKRCELEALEEQRMAIGKD